ncbi:DUF485 domain-containing protein [Nocardia sp. NBC_01329]|uniref:DUF485 domain-containing protein n=1 Tax=Nocardia sp. NBC_01329 TaxID=2903594 RepID=UPI002E11A1C3|nr:DUF485 domain-containing protein [Nocardia sp. NBC_01329]
MEHSHSDPAAPEGNSGLEKLARERARLVFRLSAVVLLLFFPLPILGGFTSLLDTVVAGGVTVAWLYAFFQFAVAIVVARYYMARAAELEARVAQEGART